MGPEESLGLRWVGAVGRRALQVEGLPEWWGHPGQDESGVGGWGGSHADKTGRDRLWGLGRGYEEGSWISCKTG